MDDKGFPYQTLILSALLILVTYESANPTYTFLIVPNNSLLEVVMMLKLIVVLNDAVCVSFLSSTWFPSMLNIFLFSNFSPQLINQCVERSSKISFHSCTSKMYSSAPEGSDAFVSSVSLQKSLQWTLYYLLHIHANDSSDFHNSNIFPWYQKRGSLSSHWWLVFLLALLCSMHQLLDTNLTFPWDMALPSLDFQSYFIPYLCNLFCEWWFLLFNVGGVEQFTSIISCIFLQFNNVLHTLCKSI